MDRHSGGGLQLNDCHYYQFRAVHIYSATRRKNFIDTKRQIPTYGTMDLGHCSNGSCLGGEINGTRSIMEDVDDEWFYRYVLETKHIRKIR